MSATETVKLSRVHWVVRPFYHYLLKNRIEEFTSDDLQAYIHNRCENLRKWLEANPKHRNLIGGICAKAQTEGIFLNTGRERPSTREEARGRKVDIYRFTDRAREELK